MTEDIAKEVSSIVGKTPVRIVQEEDEISFWFEDGSFCRWDHSQECCEDVHVEDVNGNWSDLIGHPLLVADERVCKNKDGYDETWTFYTFRSVSGSVDVRWHGSSNGYYSEKVEFVFYPPGTL